MNVEYVQQMVRLFVRAYVRMYDMNAYMEQIATQPES